MPLKSLVRQRDPGTGDRQTYAIIGAAMDVHSTLGCGFLEAVYRAALLVEFSSLGIPVHSEVPFRILYKGQDLTLRYRADLVCFESVIVEVKAVARLGPIEHAQAVNYLRVSNLRRSLVLNFGTTSLEYRRFVLGPHPVARQSAVTTEEPGSGP